MSKTDKDRPLKFRPDTDFYTNAERTVASPATVRFWKHLRHRRMRAIERHLIAQGQYEIPERIDYDYRYILAD